MNIKFWCVCFMLWAAMPLILSAQSNQKIFDLLTQIRLAESDTTRMSIYLKLSETYILQKDGEKALNYANLANILSNRHQNHKKRLQSLEKMLQIHSKIYQNLSESISILEEIQKVPNQSLYLEESALINGHRGRIFLELNDFARAQNAFFNQLSDYETLKNPEGIARVNFNLGTYFQAQEAYEQSLPYFEKSLEKYKQLENNLGSIESLNALGNSFGKLGNYDKNLEYCSQARALAHSLDDPKLLSQINANIGFAYQHLGKPLEALPYLSIALETSTTLEDIGLICQTANALGDVYFKLCYEEKAEEFYYKALSAQRVSNTLPLKKSIYESLYKYYDSKGNQDSSFFYIQKLLLINDELNNAERNRQLINNQIKYETHRKEEENKELKAKELNQEITIQKQKIQLYALLFIALMVAGLALSLWNTIRQKRNYNGLLKEEVKRRTAQIAETNEELLLSNQRLEQSNLELERFAYIASHDLKSPLRNVISFMGLIERKLKTSEDIALLEYLKFAKDNAKTMHSLIQDVLEFSRLKTRDVPTETIDLNDSIHLVIQNLQEQMSSKNAAVYIEEMPVLKGNSVHIIQLFQNLIGNGLKYNQSHQPKVFVGIEKQNGKNVFFVKDNGIGIPSEYHEQIFQMFKRLHTTKDYSGTGIGLALCKKIIAGAGGDIWLDSGEGLGTTVYFTLSEN